jgi:hypothetical protein
MLVEEELLAPEMAHKFLSWKHSGFSVYTPFTTCWNCTTIDASAAH